VTPVMYKVLPPAVEPAEPSPDEPALA